MNIVTRCAVDAQATAAYNLHTFGEEDAAHLHTITHAERRAQSIAARIALVRALAQWPMGKTTTWSLRRNAHKKPFLEPQRPAFEGETPHLSMAHSNAVAVAALSSFPCGVDIESGERLSLRRAWTRLATTEELDACARLPKALQSAYMASSWTLKEAWTKRHGDGLPRRAKEICLTPQERAPWTVAAPVPVVVFHARIGDQFLCFLAETGSATTEIAGAPIPWTALRTQQFRG